MEMSREKAFLSNSIFTELMISSQNNLKDLDQGNMACPHLKQILVNIQQGLFHKGYAVFGFSEDQFGLEWRWARDLLYKVYI